MPRSGARRRAASAAGAENDHLRAGGRVRRRRWRRSVARSARRWPYRFIVNSLLPPSESTAIVSEHVATRALVATDGAAVSRRVVGRGRVPKDRGGERFGVSRQAVHRWIGQLSDVDRKRLAVRPHHRDHHPLWMGPPGGCSTGSRPTTTKSFPSSPSTARPSCPCSIRNPGAGSWTSAPGEVP
jgi:hypothetical protein